MYYCFVCHEGGDVFTFLSKRLGLDWPSAVRLVAQTSPASRSREVERAALGPDPREPLWEVTASAAEYFRRMLWDDDGGPRGARLSRRREASIARRPTGSASATRQPAIGLMRSYLQTLGFDDARQIEAGAAVAAGGGPRAAARAFGAG